MSVTTGPEGEPVDYTSFLTPTLGIGGLVLLAVVLMLRGDLVPRKQVDALLQVKDMHIAWLEKANADLSASLEKRDSQIADMMVTARTTRHVIAALPEAAGINHEGVHHAPAPDEA